MLATTPIDELSSQGASRSAATSLSRPARSCCAPMSSSRSST